MDQYKHDIQQNLKYAGIELAIEGWKNNRTSPIWVQFLDYHNDHMVCKSPNGWDATFIILQPQEVQGVRKNKIVYKEAKWGKRYGFTAEHWPGCEPLYVFKTNEELEELVKAIIK